MFRWVTLASKPLVVLSVGMTVASGTMALSSIVSLDSVMECIFQILVFSFSVIITYNKNKVKL